LTDQFLNLHKSRLIRPKQMSWQYW